MRVDKLYTKIRKNQEIDSWYDLTVGELYSNKIAVLKYLNTDEVCDEKLLSEILDIIQLSPTGLALVQEASDMGWSLSLNDLECMDYSIDVEGKSIVLDNGSLSADAILRSPYFIQSMTITLIKALRDIWHEKRQVAFEDLFAPDAILLLERIRAADLDTISILVGWELRSEDQTNLWRHLIGSENGDLAMTYSNSLEREPTDTMGLKALRSVFYQWFQDNERVDNCDNQTLDHLDNVMNDDNHDFGCKHPTHVAIELLSSLPNKLAYLKGSGQDILRESKFSSINDPINQTHLMHILRDLKVIYAGNIAFRDASLAAKIFPAEYGVLENKN